MHKLWQREIGTWSRPHSNASLCLLHRYHTTKARFQGMIVMGDNGTYQRVLPCKCMHVRGFVFLCTKSRLFTESVWLEKRFSQNDWKQKTSTNALKIKHLFLNAKTHTFPESVVCGGKYLSELLPTHLRRQSLNLFFGQVQSLQGKRWQTNEDSGHDFLREASLCCHGWRPTLKYGKKVITLLSVGVQSLYSLNKRDNFF